MCGNLSRRRGHSVDVSKHFLLVANGGSWKIFGKSPINLYLGLNRRLWKKLPASLSTLGPVRSYGDFLHTLASKTWCLFADWLLALFSSKSTPARVNPASDRAACQD